MTAPFRGITAPPQTSGYTNASKSLAGLMEGMMQGRHQKQQELMAQLLQQSTIDLNNRNMKHMDATEANAVATLEQNTRNQNLQRLLQQFPQAEGDLSILLNPSQPNAQPAGNRVQSGSGVATPSVMDDFSNKYGQAVKGMMTTHQPQTFDENGKTFTVSNKEFNPAQMLSLGMRNEHYDQTAYAKWFGSDENKVVRTMASAWPRTKRTLDEALRSNNPTMTKSAILNFVNMADPVNRTSLGILNYMSNIDPSISGQLSRLITALDSGTLPVDQVQNMRQHLEAVVNEVQKNYDYRLNGAIPMFPRAVVRTSKDLFDNTDDFANPNPGQGQGQPGQTPGLTNGSRVEQLREKYRTEVLGQP